VVGPHRDGERQPERGCDGRGDRPHPEREAPRRRLRHRHGQQGRDELPCLQQEEIAGGPQGDAIGEPRLDEGHDHHVGRPDACQGEDGRRDERERGRRERSQGQGGRGQAEGRSGGPFEPVPSRDDRRQEAEHRERRRRHGSEEHGDGKPEPQVGPDDLQQGRQPGDRGAQVERRQGDGDRGPGGQASPAVHGARRRQRRHAGLRGSLDDGIMG